MLTLFCIPAYGNKHNTAFIKLGTNDISMTTSSQFYVIFLYFTFATYVIVKPSYQLFFMNCATCIIFAMYILLNKY